MSALDPATNPSLTSSDNLLFVAVREYQEAIDKGAPLDRAEFLGRYADIAHELSECLDNLDFLCDIAPQLNNETAERESGLSSGRSSEFHTQLGDFVIQREVGRGGMGVVYEAEQISMSRRVALKVLPFAAVLDERTLQRFRSEAQIAGQLVHQNIVPVYAVGCERSVHFYAMQYIDGQTLAEFIKGLPSSQRERSKLIARISHRKSRATLNLSNLVPTAALLLLLCYRLPVQAIATHTSVRLRGLSFR